MSIFQEFLKGFLNSDLGAIRECARNFAKIITTKIMKEEYSELKVLCKESVRMRDEIEFDKAVERTAEFYYGFWYAYENIARRLTQKDESDNQLDIVVAKNVKLRQMIKFLIDNPFAQHQEIAESLGISPSQLSTLIKKNNYFHELGIFNVQKIGRSLVYSLTNKGMSYYLKQVDGDRKLYSREQVMHIVNLIERNDNSYEGMNKGLGSLDDQLIEFIYSKQLKRLAERDLGKRRDKNVKRKAYDIIDKQKKGPRIWRAFGQKRSGQDVMGLVS